MRQYKRVRENVTVKIDLLQEHSFPGFIETGKVENISASGALIRYHKPLEVGKTISVSFLSPRSFDLFSTKARVARVHKNPDNQYELGVSFFNMNEEDQKRLNYYLVYQGDHE